MLNTIHVQCVHSVIEINVHCAGVELENKMEVLYIHHQCHTKHKNFSHLLFLTAVSIIMSTAVLYLKYAAEHSHLTRLLCIKHV